MERVRTPPRTILYIYIIKSTTRRRAHRTRHDAERRAKHAEQGWLRLFECALPTYFCRYVETCVETTFRRAEFAVRPRRVAARRTAPRAEAKLAKMPSDRDSGSDYASKMLERTENKKSFLRPGQSDIKDIEERHCTDVHQIARSAPNSRLRLILPAARTNPAAMAPNGGLRCGPAAGH